MRYFKMLKNWYTVARPHKGLLITQFFTSILANALVVVATIPAAYATAAVSDAINSNGSFNDAFIWLSVAFGVLLLRQVVWHFDYKIMPIQLKHVYNGAIGHMINKIFTSDDHSLKITSKEKIINTISSNVYNLGEFPNTLTTKFAYVVRALIMFIILISTDWKVGLVVVGAIVLLYFILRSVHTKLGVMQKTIESNKDAVFEGFSDMLDSRVISSDLNISDQLKNDYESRTQSLMAAFKKRRLLQSIKDNWVFALWNLFATGLALFIVFQMSEGSNIYTLSLYLMITPYITSTLEFFCEFFNVFTDIETANVSATRVSAIYNMTEKELVEFGDNVTDKIDARIQFKRVSCRPNKVEAEGCTRIKNISFKVNPGEIALIQGQRGSGKRTLFYLMRRVMRPSSGRILIGNIDIFDYDRKSYVHNFGYVTSKPFFFNASIMENLKYIEKDEKKIKKACKLLGIHKLIMDLPNGYDTNMTIEKENISEYLSFMIGFVRVVLTRCEILVIYEFPRLGKDETELVKNNIKAIRDGHAIVIFSANDYCKDIVNKHYVISKGEMELIQ